MIVLSYCVAALCVLFIALATAVLSLGKQVGEFMRGSMTNMHEMSLGPVKGTDMGPLISNVKLKPEHSYTVVLLVSDTCSSCLSLVNSLKLLLAKKSYDNLVCLIQKTDDVALVSPVVESLGIPSAFTDKSILSNYGLRQFPTILVIGGNGKLLATYMGSMAAVYNLCEYPEKFVKSGGVA